jgi:hypothetical protein
MSVTATNALTSATGTGSATSFPFTFACRNVADLSVYVNGTLQTSGYSVTLNAGFNGGTVLFAVAPANAATIIISSTPSLAQPISFEDAGPYNPSTVDGMADAAAIRDIALQGQLNRAPLAPLGETMGPLPAKATRAGLSFGFDALGNPVAVNPGGADSALRTDLAGPTGYTLVGGTRKKLAANLTYFVNPSTGSDTNDGLTVGTSLATAQKAIAKAYSELDLCGFQVIIQLAHATHSNPIQLFGLPLGAWTYAGAPIQIIGDEVTPSNVVLATVSNTALTVDGKGFVLIAGVLTTTTVGGYGWVVRGQSHLQHRNCQFGNVVADMMNVAGASLVEALGATNFSGNADSCVHATEHSRVTFTSQTITFNGNTFATYLWGLNDATVAIDQTTITGARPTGNTLVHDHSLLNAYSLTNAGGWGFLGTGTFNVNDGSCVTADQYVNRQFYVRSDAAGNTNDGLENTTGRAFKSIQSCIDFISAITFNPADYNSADGVHIAVADGTYAETIHARNVKYANLNITGNVTTPTNVVINGVDDGCACIGVQSVLNVQGMQLNAAAGSGLRAEQGGVINFDHIDFGNCTGAHIRCTSGGAIRTSGAAYTISHSAPYHIQNIGGFVNLSAYGAALTVTISNTPAFSVAFAYGRSNGAMVCDHTQVTFTGSATGVRYDLASNASIDTTGGGTSGGATYLPGGTSGVTATGGQYA